MCMQARQIWEALLYAQPGIRESEAGAAAFETMVRAFPVCSADGHGGGDLAGRVAAV